MVDIARGLVTFIIFLLLVIGLLILVKIFSGNKNTVDPWMIWGDILGVIILAFIIIVIIALIYSSTTSYTPKEEKEEIKKIKEKTK